MKSEEMVKLALAETHGSIAAVGSILSYLMALLTEESPEERRNLINGVKRLNITSPSGHSLGGDYEIAWDSGVNTVRANLVKYLEKTLNDDDPPMKQGKA